VKGEKTTEIVFVVFRKHCLLVIVFLVATCLVSPNRLPTTTGWDCRFDRIAQWFGGGRLSMELLAPSGQCTGHPYLDRGWSIPLQQSEWAGFGGTATVMVKAPSGAPKETTHPNAKTAFAARREQDCFHTTSFPWSAEKWCLYPLSLSLSLWSSSVVRGLGPLRPE
jgi:hypothetical protein